MTRSPLFIFIGPPGHGKTTARRLFTDLVGLRGASTSDVIYATLADHLGVTETELRALPKEELRPKLIEWGDFLCGVRDTLELTAVPGKEPSSLLYHGPSALIRALFLNDARAIDGVRRRAELVSATKFVNWLGLPVMAVWVERTHADAPVIKDNTEVTAADAQYVIVNDGTVEDLKAKLQALVAALTPPAQGGSGGA